MTTGKLAYSKAISVETMRNVETDPLGTRIRDMVQEFEAYMSKKTGRVYVAVRTRQTIVKKGFKKVVKSGKERCVKVKHKQNKKQKKSRASKNRGARR